ARVLSRAPQVGGPPGTLGDREERRRPLASGLGLPARRARIPCARGLDEVVERGNAAPDPPRVRRFSFSPSREHASSAAAVPLCTSRAVDSRPIAPRDRPVPPAFRQGIAERDRWTRTAPTGSALPPASDAKGTVWAAHLLRSSSRSCPQEET